MSMPDVDLETIIRRLRRNSEYMFGSDRLFLAPVLDAMEMPKRDAAGVLIALNRAGRIRLHRADLPSAMNRDLVRRSEITYLNATFHFIEV